jgi:hypothetical protein
VMCFPCHVVHFMSVVGTNVLLQSLSREVCAIAHCWVHCWQRLVGIRSFRDSLGWRGDLYPRSHHFPRWPLSGTAPYGIREAWAPLFNWGSRWRASELWIPIGLSNTLTGFTLPFASSLLAHQCWSQGCFYMNICTLNSMPRFAS